MLNNIDKNKWIYLMILVLFIILTIFLFVSGPEEQNENIAATDDAAVENQLPVTPENTQQETVTEGYYMVREVDGKVNVYWCDGTSEMIYRETAIAFSLLSLEDQQMLKSGVRLDTDQELAGFLENYDS